jgi:ketosteroid isomerase-like protein
MKTFRTFALCTLLACSPALAPAATAPTPPPEIMKLAMSPVVASNTNDGAGFTGIFTDDAVVVDENDPFEWRGATAGTDWWNRVNKALVSMKAVGFHAAPGSVSEYVQTGDAAYLIMPITLSATAGGKPFMEHGTMTYTFRKVGGVWKISTFVWTTKP